MKGKSLKEWIDIYEKKTGDKAELPKGYRLFYSAKRGFASMNPDVKGNMLVIYQVCGDLQFWLDFAEIQAAGMNLECVAAVLVRNIEPYIQALEWEILEREEKNGCYRYWCQDAIGRLGIITHAGIKQATGKPVYWATYYLNAKATSPMIEEMKNRIGIETEGEKFYGK